MVASLVQRLILRSRRVLHVFILRRRRALWHLAKLRSRVTRDHSCITGMTVAAGLRRAPRSPLRERRYANVVTEVVEISRVPMGRSVVSDRWTVAAGLH